MRKSRDLPIRGFTIVELLIVIVVIAILAALSVVAYNGIQQRARDTQRKSDIAQIVKGLELYYTIHGQYPAASGSTTINSGWSTTADASWQNLVNLLEPHAAISKKDPLNTNPTGESPISGTNTNAFAYSYFAVGAYCGAPSRQIFILVYRLENGAQENVLHGECPSNPLGPYGTSSNYRVRK